MAEKAYKFRLYPNKQQEELIRKTCGCARFVYNATLAARQTAYKAGTPLSGNDCVKMLPGLKLQYIWLKEVDSTALQSRTGRSSCPSWAGSKPRSPLQ